MIICDQFMSALFVFRRKKAIEKVKKEKQKEGERERERETPWASTEFCCSVNKRRFSAGR